MPRGGSARRHAQAVFQIALARNELDKWHADLKKIAELVANPSLRAFLESPKLPLQEKLDLVQEKLKDLNPLSLNLVGLLITRGRLALSTEIAEEYERLLNVHRGIQEVEVISAVPLEEAEQDLLRQRLSQLLDKRIILRPRQDDTIVGGLVVKTDELLLDGSIKSKLEGLKKSLLEAGR
ncbi:MAG: F0F1 ATP synthase subunit delta [Chloroflexota bacterium]